MLPLPPQQMGGVMRVALWGLAGLVAGAALVFAVGMALPMITPISQAEGAYAMAVAFVWTPIGAVMGAVGGVVVALVRRPA